MKRISLVSKIFIIITAGILAFSSVSCVLLDNDGKLLPPGQAKRITGDDNAKDLAPGKDKKK